MQIRDVMTKPAIRIHPKETVAVAARMLEHYNIGILPVCGQDGKVRGMVTDRDLVIRCLASGKAPGATPVEDVMTKQVVSVPPETEVQEALCYMAQRQIRRLPVVEKGKLCGMVSLGDMAVKEETVREAASALGKISGNLSVRD